MMGKVVWSNMAEITAEPVRWLWDGRIPRGKLTVLDGEPGIGKSTLALDLAAKVSRGAAMPLSRSAPNAPGNVIIFSGDDDLADTVRPRLEAAGADLTRIRPIGDEIRPGELDGIQPALIVLDPLSGYISLATEETTREVMQHLAQLASETDAAILLVQCLPDREDTDWARQVYAVARSVLKITPVGHGGRRVGVTKSNLRPIAEVPPLVYHLEDKGDAPHLIGWSDGR
jgi:KaiC/GvpD/RAD55 family RecA-like ATPase